MISLSKGPLCPHLGSSSKEDTNPCAAPPPHSTLRLLLPWVLKASLQEASLLGLSTCCWSTGWAWGGQGWGSSRHHASDTAGGDGGCSQDTQLHNPPHWFAKLALGVRWVLRTSSQTDTEMDGIEVNSLQVPGSDPPSLQAPDPPLNPAVCTLVASLQGGEPRGHLPAAEVKGDRPRAP